MSKKDKILYIIFSLVSIFVIVAVYLKYLVKEDYFIKIEVPCDPSKSSCFLRECEPGVDEECPESEEERLYYYKNITKKASLIPKCDLDEDCQVIDCENDSTCFETYCDEYNVPEGETCFFNSNNE